ncbi:MAG: membrane protein insertase YidC, partial [Lutibacter sp.]|nr:membrane protein insertase YidC [Lutibacter sp.]
MEEKKFDLNSLIGFVLLGAIMFWWMYTSQPVPEVTGTTGNDTEQVQKAASNNNESAIGNPATLQANDSTTLIQAQNALGAFARSASLAMVGEQETVLENDLLKLVISNKGGQIKEALIKQHLTYDSLPLYMIEEANASFDIGFGTTDNRTLHTKNLFFEPSLTSQNGKQILSMKLKVSEAQYLEYRYEMKPDDYMVDFTVRSQGLERTLNSEQAIELNWQLKGYRHEKSIRYENQQTEMYYEKDDDEIDYLSIGGDDDALESGVNWVAYKQHFFSSILVTDKAFDKATLVSETLFEDEEVDSLYTKAFSLNTPLALESGELSYQMHWYIGPNDYQILKKYDRNLKEVVNLGWGIFGVINRVIFIPVFQFLQGFISNYGLIII